MDHVYRYILVLHLISGSLWLGETLVVNFILFPALRRDPNEAKRDFVLAVYRRLFNMSTMSAIISSATGIVLIWFAIASGQFGSSDTSWQVSMALGGVFGLVILVLHLIEKVNMVRLKEVHRKGTLDTAVFLKKVKWIPRLSCILVVATFLIMLNAVYHLI